jgi:hypothetical protein
MVRMNTILATAIVPVDLIVTLARTSAASQRTWKSMRRFSSGVSVGRS